MLSSMTKAVLVDNQFVCHECLFDEVKQVIAVSMAGDLITDPHPVVPLQFKQVRVIRDVIADLPYLMSLPTT